ncbi:MAG: hypothetical protein OQL06_03290, partial [Gammaproteobacteria bacterium]|nr:hypothetical protein [Gammaproteobacteria bacterium]
QKPAQPQRPDWATQAPQQWQQPETPEWVKQRQAEMEKYRPVAPRQGQWPGQTQQWQRPERSEPPEWVKQRQAEMEKRRSQQPQGWGHQFGAPNSFRPPVSGYGYPPQYRNQNPWAGQLPVWRRPPGSSN